MIESTTAKAEVLSLVNDIGVESQFWGIRQATALRNALRLNASFSLVSGIAMVAGAEWLVTILGLDSDRAWTLRVIGLGLLVFAGYLLFESAAPRKRLLTSAILISIADAVWVLGSLVLVLFNTFSPAGVVIVGAVALVVANFAVMQLRARRRCKEVSVNDVANSESPPTEAAHFTGKVRVDPVKLWPVMIDHGLYGRLAANLGSVTAVAPNGPGLVRECSDTNGGSWSETCTLWDPGKRFAVNVETTAPDYPYALQLMQGTWGVEASAIPASSKVTMAFAFRPLPGLRGRMMVIAMHLVSGLFSYEFSKDGKAHHSEQRIFAFTCDSPRH